MIKNKYYALINKGKDNDTFIDEDIRNKHNLTKQSIVSSPK